VLSYRTCSPPLIKKRGDDDPPPLPPTPTPLLPKGVEESKYADTAAAAVALDAAVKDGVPATRAGAPLPKPNPGFPKTADARRGPAREGERERWKEGATRRDR
jgi:hypothetical protein